MTGTTAAQAIPILVSPLLTRIYSTADFGILTAFLSIVTLASVVATARYDYAIILPENDRDAADLLSLALSIAVFFCILLQLIVAPLAGPISSSLGVPALAPWLWLVPIAVLIKVATDTLTQWAVRKRTFSELSRSRVMEAGVTAATRVGYGQIAPSPGGLLVGQLLGQGVGLMRLVRSYLRQMPWRVDRTAIRRQAARYRDFPKYSIVAVLLNNAARELPVLLFAPFFGVTVVGLFGFAQRTVRAPLSILGSSLSDVFRERAATQFAQTGDCRDLYLRTLKRLTLVALLVLAPLFVAAPTLFRVVFGSEWGEAGVYVRLMIVFFFFQFVAGPLSSMFYVAEKQKSEVAWQAALCVVTTAAVLVGHYVLESARASVFLFGMSYAAMYAISLAMTYSYTTTVRSELSP